jgi:hypothetical protein
MGFTGPMGFTGDFQFKSFIIDNPIKDDSYLVHACLEGPETGVYYRGVACVYEKYVIVELPLYVNKIAENFTVHVTHMLDDDNDEPKTYAVTYVKNNKFKIYGPKGKVSWVVYGSRGNFNTEPKKSDVNIQGCGPYKYIC